MADGPGPASADRSGRVAWVAVAVGLALSLGLMSLRLAEPMSGFLAFNEGFYLLPARSLAGAPLLESFARLLASHDPPLHLLLLSLVVRAGGASVALGRALTIACTAGAILYVFLLGRLLYNARVGAMAAVLFALAPATVVVGRNIQVDALLVLAETAAVFHWLRASRDDHLGHAAAAGAAIGLAVLTKLPAFVIVAGLVAWETVRARGLGWLRERRVLVAAGVALALAAPWAIAQAVAAPAFSQGQAYLAGRAHLGRAAGWYLGETFWMAGPPLALAALAGVGVMTARRRRADLPVAIMLGLTMAFLLYFDLHSYYWLPALPYVALAAGRGIDSLRVGRGRPALAVAGVTAAASVLVAVLALAGMKYGGWHPDGLARQLPRSTGRVWVVVDETIRGAYGPAVDFYVPRAKVTAAGPQLDSQVGTDTVVYVSSQRDQPDALATLAGTRVRAVLFGLRVWQRPPNRNQFQQGPWEVESAGPPWLFALEETPTREGSLLLVQSAAGKVR